MSVDVWAILRKASVKDAGLFARSTALADRSESLWRTPRKANAPYACKSPISARRRGSWLSTMITIQGKSVDCSVGLVISELVSCYTTRRSCTARLPTYASRRPTGYQRYNLACPRRRQIGGGAARASTYLLDPSTWLPCGARHPGTTAGGRPSCPSTSWTGGPSCPPPPGYAQP